MDDIKSFIKNFKNRFPQTWIKIDDYVKVMLPSEKIDPFSFKSKYEKTHICIFLPEGAEYIPEDKASKEQIEKTLEVFNMNLIDYEEIFNDLGKDYFILDDWAEKRLEKEINGIKEFLFDCNTYKANYFIKNLLDELNVIESNLGSLWKAIKPNELQEEITEELKTNLRYIREFITEDLSGKGLDDKNPIQQSKKSKESTVWYKLAYLICDGSLEFEGSKYIISGTEFKTDRSASEKLSELIDISWKSIKPYLNTTKSYLNGNKERDYGDKNIFQNSKTRIYHLNLIEAEAKHNGSPSLIFTKNLELLRSKNN